MSKKNYKEQVENSPYSKEAKETGSRLYNLRTEKRLSMADVSAQVESAQRDDDKKPYTLCVSSIKLHQTFFYLGKSLMEKNLVIAISVI